MQVCSLVVSCNVRFSNLFTGTHYEIELCLIEKPEMICVSNAEPSFKYVRTRNKSRIQNQTLKGTFNP